MHPSRGQRDGGSAKSHLQPARAQSHFTCRSPTSCARHEARPSLKGAHCAPRALCVTIAHGDVSARTYTARHRRPTLEAHGARYGMHTPRDAELHRSVAPCHLPQFAPSCAAPSARPRGGCPRSAAVGGSERGPYAIACKRRPNRHAPPTRPTRPARRARSALNAASRSSGSMPCGPCQRGEGGAGGRDGREGREAQAEGEG